MNVRSMILVAAGAALAALTAACGSSDTDPVREPLSRTDLQRRDLSVPGREALQTRVDFQPGAQAARHKHPGEEIIYVLKGTLVYDIDGQGPRTVAAGDVLFVPAETYHSVRNIGNDEGSELATYVVEKDKPLLELAKP